MEKLISRGMPRAPLLKPSLAYCDPRGSYGDLMFLRALFKDLAPPRACQAVQTTLPRDKADMSDRLRTDNIYDGPLHDWGGDLDIRRCGATRCS